MKDDATRELLDFSYSDNQPLHSWRYRAWVTVPFEGLAPDVPIKSIGMHIRYINNHLSGRDPLTFIHPTLDKLVASFAIENLSEDSMQKVGVFATSLCAFTYPTEATDPDIRVQMNGEFI